MTKAADRIAGLSPKKRALLLAKLKERRQQGADLAPSREVSGRIEWLPRPAGAAEVARPVSFSQLREWILDRFEPGTAAYNIPMWIELTGRLSVPALAGALAGLGARHESLRTAFRAPDHRAARGGAPPLDQAEQGELYPGEPVQVVFRDLRPGLALIDLAGLPEAARRPAAGGVERLHARLPFDLSRAPLFRAALLRLGAEEHRLLLSMHHIVSDGWSMGVLFRDLGELYRARAAGEHRGEEGGGRARLSPLPIQYGDFAAWQRRRLRGETLERLVGYWRGRLQGAVPVLELPADRPRQAERTHRAGTVSLRIGPELAASLRREARRREASLFMVLLTGLDALLFRLTGQADLSVGTYIANRNRAETADLVGFFVNTLVLRARLEGDPPLGEVVTWVREVTLGAYDHQDLPFEKLLDALQPKRDPGRTPLFQTLCVLQNTPRPRLAFSGLTFRGRTAVAEKANFELSAFFAEGVGDGDGEGGWIDGNLEYDRGLFDATTVRRWARSLVAVLEALATRPETRLSEAPVLARAERHQVCREWGEAAGPAPAGAGTVVELLAARARLDPAAPALESAAGEVTTYGELLARVQALARGLAREGVAPGAVVAVLARSGPEAVATFLGVLAAGAAYLPLDPEYPAERLAYLARDAGASLAVAAAGTPPEALAGLGVRAVAPAALAKEGGRAGPGPPPAFTESGGLAYVLYTSGSTGEPKGVEVTHGNLARYARIAAEGYALAPGDRVLQFASLSFDASAEEIYPCLAAGATLVCRDAAAPPAPAELMELVERRGVTVLDLPTAYWHALAAAQGGAGRPPASLRLVILGGEAARSEAVAAWRRGAGADARLVNTYGPTEATVVSSWCDLAGSSWCGLAGRAAAAPVPIGRPIPGVRLILADRRLRPVPPGAAGEVAIGGGGVARGYRGRPALTAERFVPDPWSAEPGARLYRSGDLGRFVAATGEIEFAGRIDDQVKVRGYRIEPGEVEAALGRLPGVREAAVVARREESGAHRLVAYVVADAEAGPDGGAASAGELRARLAERLPGHMIPAAFVTLPALPLTQQGKVDRRRLLSAGSDGTGGGRLDGGAVYAAPRTPVERALAAAWREVLGVERAGVHDNFFDLGGDSLLLLQVHERIATLAGGGEGGRPLQVLDLFRYPTIEALAGRLEPRSENRRGAEAVAERAARQRQALRARQGRGVPPREGTR